MKKKTDEKNSFETLEKESFGLGFMTFLKTPGKADEICNLQKQNVALEGEAEKTMKMLEGQRISFDEERITNSLNAGGGEPPIQTVTAEVNQGYVGMGTTLALLVPAYFLIVWGLKPFEMGEETYLVAVGISIAVTVSFHGYLYFLTKVLPERTALIWKMFFALAAAVLGGIGIVYLSLVRNQIVYVNMVMGNESNLNNLVSNFYGKALGYLRLVFPLFALALDIIAAVTLNAALSKLTYYRPTLEMLKRLEESREEMVDIASELKEIEVRPEIFERNFLMGKYFAEGDQRRR